MKSERAVKTGPWSHTDELRSFEWSPSYDQRGRSVQFGSVPLPLRSSEGCESSSSDIFFFFSLREAITVVQLSSTYAVGDWAQSTN